MLGVRATCANPIHQFVGLLLGDGEPFQAGAARGISQAHQTPSASMDENRAVVA